MAGKRSSSNKSRRLKKPSHQVHVISNVDMKRRLSEKFTTAALEDLPEALTGNSNLKTASTLCPSLLLTFKSRDRATCCWLSSDGYKVSHRLSFDQQDISEPKQPNVREPKQPLGTLRHDILSEAYRLLSPNTERI